MKSKHYVYACVGLRPSERREVVHLLTENSPEQAFLRAANPREIPDFWIVNADEPASLRYLEEAGAVHVLEVASRASDRANSYCLLRPLMADQILPVLRHFWQCMPEPVPDRIADQFDLDEQFVVLGDPKLGARLDSELASTQISTGTVELTPSELAMTEDDPDELAELRQAAVQRSMQAETLEPWTDGLDMSQEWLDVMPAQLLVITELGDRTRTLPKGLRKMGFGVDVIDGFETALHRLKISEYKVVFLDQGAAGRLLLTWCRALLAARNVRGQGSKVVVIGRKRTPWERWRAIRAGISAWMPVPLDRRQLLDFLTQQGVERSLPREY